VDRGVDLGGDLLGLLGRGVRGVRGGVLGLACVVSGDVEGLGGGLGGLELLELEGFQGVGEERERE